MPVYDPYQSGPSSSDQWKRRWKLELTGPGDNLVVSESVDPLPNEEGIAGGDGFRMTFSTVQSRIQTPASSTITVYNTALGNQISSLVKQYNRVNLYAGYYNGHFGLIFHGTIAYMQRGRDEDLVDTYLRMTIIDGDWPLNGTTFNKSYAAGTTEGEKAKETIKEMAKNGGLVGFLAGLPDKKMPRGHVAYGMAPDILRGLGIPHYVEFTKINTYDPSAIVNPGSAFILNSETGLVGIPTVTPDGVELTCLINSDFRLNSLVKVDQAAINSIASPLQSPNDVLNSVPVQNSPFGAPGFVADTSADGLYAIISKEYEGDTRGNAWYCHLVLFAANAVSQGVRGPLGSPNQGNVPIDIGIGPTAKQIDISNNETA